MGRYRNIKIRKDSPVKPGVRFYTTTLYPEIPLSSTDIYVITTDGDRLDILAQQYYGNSNHYWIIAAANSNVPRGTLNLPPGTQLRIPQDVAGILAQFQTLNQL